MGCVLLFHKVMGQETVTGGWNDKSSKAGNLLTKAFVLALYFIYLFIYFINGGFEMFICAGGDVEKNRLEFGSVYQQEQQERVQPCHLSSSIYYGGPDVYFQPQSQNSSANSAAVIQILHWLYIVHVQ